jgi:hypothetical protein
MIYVCSAYGGRMALRMTLDLGVVCGGGAAKRTLKEGALPFGKPA